MSPLHLIAPFSDRLGWMLLHSTWQFVLIALVALALQRILRDGAATVRYGLLLVALATMPLLPIVTWIVLPQPPAATGTAGSANWPDAERRDRHERAVAAAEPADAGQSTAPPAVARPARAADVAESPRAATQVTAREPAAAAAWRHGLERRLRPWLPSLVACWCAGVLVFSLRPLLSWYAVQRLRRVGVSAVPQSVRILLDRAAERLRVWQHVELLQSARVGTPVVVGVFRPIILLPMSAVTGVPAVHLEAILVHELAHVRRHDYIVNVVQTLLETIFFYHPAVWWLSHQIRREREHCCDDVAVAALGSPVEYGRALLALEEQRDAAAVLAIGAADGLLLSRIRRLRRGTPNVPAWPMTTLAGSAAFPALLVAVGVWSLVVAQENQQGQGSAGERSSTPALESEIGAEAVIQSSGEQATAVATERPLQIWKVRLVDGENDQPVEGVRVSARPGADAPPIMLTSDPHGLVEVPLPAGTGTTLKVETPGWWSEMFPLVGEAEPDRQPPAASEADVREPAAAVTHKLWRGTIVTGRVLRPAGEPAAGIALTVGVYINNRQWKERLGMDLAWYSFDHGQWPNWTIRLVTDEAGRFETTVPPPDARSWVRVSTGRELTEFAPSEWEFPGGVGFERELSNGVYFRDLQLEHGVTLRGRVLDAEDQGLPGVILHASGTRGPYDGRNTVSGDEGQFKFLPMKPGSLTIRPDARLRDKTGNLVSRDDSAVFIPQTLTLPDTDEPVETTIRAVPHRTLEFEWIDRRAEKGPVAYYGAFSVSGQVPTAEGGTVRWRGETARTTRDGREILFVKVPRSLHDPTLTLPADRVVTASYEDDQQVSGPGTVKLGDITTPRRRIIYGDEPAGRR